MTIARCIIGEKAADLPTLAINRKTAKMLGLTLPLARADEVIE